MESYLDIIKRIEEDLSALKKLFLEQSQELANANSRNITLQKALDNTQTTRTIEKYIGTLQHEGKSFDMSILIKDILKQDCFVSVSTDRLSIASFRKLVTHVKFILAKNNYNKLGDLVKVSTSDLLRINSLGIRSVAFIVLLCEHYGLKLTIDCRKKSILKEMEKLKKEIIFYNC